MKISWAPWVFLPLRGAGRCLTELKMQLQKQIFLTNPCGFLGRMESSRLGLWCLSTSLQSQESRGMKTGRRWEWRLSCPFPNEKQLPACKQQKVWGKTECWYHIKLENFYISCRIWIVYFSLLVLQIYNKLRIKHTFFFFLVGLSLSSPQCLGFPQSYQVLIWKICCRQVGEKKASYVKCPLGHGGTPRERKRERARAHACAWAARSLSNRKKLEQQEVRTVEAGVYLGAGWNSLLHLRYYTNLIVGSICCIYQGHL